MSLGRKKGIKEMIEAVRVHSRSRIFDSDQNLGWHWSWRIRSWTGFLSAFPLDSGNHPRHQLQLSRAVQYRAHRLNSVNHEVQNYLLHLDPVRRYERQIVGKLGSNQNAMSL